MRPRLVSAREWENLSGYLDGQLNPKQSLRIESQLKARPELSEALEELRRTQTILRAQGVVHSPRNFTLTPQMAGIKTAPPNMWISGFRLVSALKFSSALAGALFLITIFAHFLISGASIQTANVAMAPAPQEIVGETPQAREAETTVAVAAMQPSPTSESMDTMREAPPAANKLMLPPTEEAVGGMGGQIPEPTSLPSLAATAPQVLITESFSATLITALPSSTISSEVTAKAVPAYPEPIQTEAALAAPPVTYPGPEVIKIQKPRLSTDPWLWLEVGLGVLAIGTGLTAFVLRRSGE